ncbi:MAG: PspC domain-containing protein [Chloroflexi bacterium]|nr:PspC domain-containing protein [Chloroflexota bacterium]
MECVSQLHGSATRRVCGGIAGAFRVNGWIVRVLFAVGALLTSGAVALYYAALWLAMPQGSLVIRRGGISVDARRPAVGRRYRRRMDRRALSSAADAGGAELIPAGGRGRLWVDPDLPAGEGVMRDQRNFLIGLLVLAVGAVLIGQALGVLPAGLNDLLLRALPAVLIALGLGARCCADVSRSPASSRLRLPRSSSSMSRWSRFPAARLNSAPIRLSSSLKPSART